MSTVRKSIRREKVGVSEGLASARPGVGNGKERWTEWSRDTVASADSGHGNAWWIQVSPTRSIGVVARQVNGIPPDDNGSLPNFTTRYVVSSTGYTTFDVYQAIVPVTGVGTISLLYSDIFKIYHRWTAFPITFGTYDGPWISSLEAVVGGNDTIFFQVYTDLAMNPEILGHTNTRYLFRLDLNSGSVNAVTTAKQATSFPEEPFYWFPYYNPKTNKLIVGSNLTGNGKGGSHTPFLVDPDATISFTDVLIGLPAMEDDYPQIGPTGMFSSGGQGKLFPSANTNNWWFNDGSVSLRSGSDLSVVVYDFATALRNLAGLDATWNLTAIAGISDNGIDMYVRIARGGLYKMYIARTNDLDQLTAIRLVSEGSGSVGREYRSGVDGEIVDTNPWYPDYAPSIQPIYGQNNVNNTFAYGGKMWFPNGKGIIIGASIYADDKFWQGTYAEWIGGKAVQGPADGDPYSVRVRK